MTIVVVGLDTQTAPLELRERLALSGDELQHSLLSLREQTQAEIVIVSTCNRVEVYASAADGKSLVRTITEHFANRAATSPAALKPLLRTLVEREAVQHLMRVACGLESLVLGESEILGQVADALRHAQMANSTGPILSRLFQHALYTGKRARTETAISTHTLSISHAAVLMAHQQLGDLSNVNALVVGAGHMAELAVRALQSQGAKAIHVINRSDANAHLLADRTNAQALEWKQFPSALQDADLVITATSAPNPLLNGANITTDHPMLLIDIAVPRNIHADVRRLPNISLYDIDDLDRVVSDHRALRQRETTQVDALIADEVEVYFGWLNSREAISTIVALRQKAETMAENEVTRTLHALPNLDERERELVTLMAHRIVNKLLHDPTTALREQSAQGDHFTYIHAVRELFALEGEA